jgi:hypothetical protein
MKRILSLGVVVIMALSPCLVAAGTVAGTAVLAPEMQGNRADGVRVALVKDAELAYASLKFSSDRKTDKEVYDDLLLCIREAQRQAGAQKTVAVVVLPPLAGEASYRKSESFMSFFESGSAPVGLLQISTRLEDNDDIYQATNRLVSFVQSLRLPAKATPRLGPVAISVADPEQYKDALLQLVKERVERLRKLLGDSLIVDIANIQAPVEVAPINARQVRLSIPFTITYHEPRAQAK